MKNIPLSHLVVSFLLVLPLMSKAQDDDWQPAHYYDVNNIKHTGYVQITTFDNLTRYGNSKVKVSEWFKFEANEKAPVLELYALDMQSVVTNTDSIVVRHSFRTDRKGNVKTDSAGNQYTAAGFYRVELNNSDTKIYSKSMVGNNAFANYTAYYFGKDADNIYDITNDNFAQIMTGIMKDAPDLVEKIKNGDFKLRKMEKLLIAYKKEKGVAIPAN
ncbi:MAG TPA: hypothetical protein VHS53_17410 [Mucilaginibacter sp.]|nr:hypothetical protein [Mucilaginibacter sp.]